MNAGEIAELIAAILSGEQPPKPNWEVTGLDLGEVEIVTGNGQKIRLIIIANED